jgi:hypothetical protein
VPWKYAYLYLQMAGSRGSNASHLSGDYLDSESSVASSHASKNSDFCRKRPRLTQNSRQSLGLYGFITTEMDQLPTYSDPRNKDCPYPICAHWTEYFEHLDLKIMKLIKRVGFFCNLRGYFYVLLIPMMQIKFKSRCFCRARGQLR